MNDNVLHKIWQNCHRIILKCQLQASIIEVKNKMCYWETTRII